MTVRFNKQALRVKKAKAAHVLLKPALVRATQLLVPILALAAAASFFVAELAAWLLVAFLVWLLVVMQWRDGDLRTLDDNRLQPVEDELHVDEQAAADVVRLLDGDVSTPKTVWDALKGSWHQKFFSVRFGLGLELFEPAIPDDVANGERLWARAHELSRKYDLDVISGGALIVALIESLPIKDRLLANLGLTDEDLEAGVLWQEHISTMARQSRTDRSIGSLGRDWASGYTPLLSRFAQDLSSHTKGASWRRQIESHREIIDKLIQLLADSKNANAAIIGDPGVGKSTLVRGLAHRLQTSAAPLRLRSYKVFEINAAQLIAKARSAGSVEGVVQALFAEANAAGNVVLVFDDAESFLGGDTAGHVDISAMLVTLIERTRVPLLFSMTPRVWQGLQQDRSPLAGVLNPYIVKPARANEIMTILEDQSVFFEYQRDVLIAYQALKEAVRLSDEYVHDLAQPGASIRTLDSAINFASEGSFVSEQSVQRAVEGSQGVKVQKADASEKEQLLHLEDKIHERLVNQTRAVSVVSDALRRARSGVGSKDKPMGTFLFLGPTGVGKTELARALADVMFQGEESIVRVDMNEFSQPGSIERLLSLDANSPDSLLAKIQRQPYSVVLLDEIEKADGSVLDALLQMLDEGVMRDQSNEEISFRNAIIIATSNAGANAIRTAIEAGREVSDFEKEFIDSLIMEGEFKPEFLNRFDETVVFRPLTSDELLLVVDILMRGVNKQLAQKQITVELSDDAKQLLVETGYDARLGARPLRRVIQRAVESTVAESLLKDEIAPGDHVRLTADDIKSKLESS